MSNKMVELKNELESKLQAETARASAVVWDFKYVNKPTTKKAQRQYEQWLEYRTIMFKNMMWVKNMKINQFVKALETNERMIQQAIWGN